VDNLSGVSGGHNWKVGLDVNVSPQFQNRAQQYQGVYNFASLAAYVSRTIQRFQQSIPLNPESGAYRGTQREGAVFVTDQWQARRNLNVTAGLRWEGQWNPQPPNSNPRFPQTAVVPNDLAMWQPRLGLAWKPGKSDRGVLRLSAGIFTARTPATIFSRVFHDNGLNVIGIDSNV
jgi:outer membrane receptor protein involved in Fe transport